MHLKQKQSELNAKEEGKKGKRKGGRQESMIKRTREFTREHASEYTDSHACRQVRGGDRDPKKLRNETRAKSFDRESY